MVKENVPYIYICDIRIRTYIIYSATFDYQRACSSISSTYICIYIYIIYLSIYLSISKKMYNIYIIIIYIYINSIYIYIYIYVYIYIISIYLPNQTILKSSGSTASPWKAISPIMATQAACLSSSKVNKDSSQIFQIGLFYFLITYPFYILSCLLSCLLLYLLSGPKNGPGQATCSGWRPSCCCKWIGPPPPPPQCWWSYRPPRPCQRLPARCARGCGCRQSQAS